MERKRISKLFVVVMGMLFSTTMSAFSQVSGNFVNFKRFLITMVSCDTIIKHIEYPPLAPALIDKTMGGEYNDSTKVLSLNFNFTDPTVKVDIYRNFNRIETESFSITPGDEATFDMSGYAPGYFQVRIIRQELNDTLFGVWNNKPYAYDPNFGAQSFPNSDDADAFSVSVSGRTISVAFDLDEPSRVSLSVATPYGQFVGQQMATTMLDGGHHEVQLAVGQPGLYVVTYYVNGRNYDRKVSIK